MKRRWWVLPVGPAFAIAVGLASAPSCQPSFPATVSGQGLAITITGGDLGTPDARLPLTFTTPDVFTVSVQALDENGNLDSSYNSYVRFSVEPGTVASVAGPNASGRNVQLVNGVANNVAVSVVGAFGDARISVEDLGYVPADPLRTPPPQCANGKDDNDNGLVDYPVDPGCYAANDDTEDGGSYAGAASENIYFIYPTVADVNGAGNSGAGTPFPNEQVEFNTGWNGSTTSTRYGLVVNGVSSTGFFVTDIGNTQGYASVYGYTYTAPVLMNVCDRLITFGGTAAEFYGFLEINYPTWSLEQWDPLARPCLVPEPTIITVAQLYNNAVGVLTPLEAGLVRVPDTDGSTIQIASLFGPGLVPRLYACANGMPPSPNTAAGVCSDSSTPAFTGVGPLTADATSCDYEGTGKIDYENAEESACETACTNNIQCSEYSQYASNSQFQLVVTNADGTSQVQITADGSASAQFDPVALKGTKLLAFTGNLTYFSGGQQFTIQARCADDIVLPGGTILPSSPPWPVPDGGASAQAACVVNTAIQATNN